MSGQKCSKTKTPRQSRPKNNSWLNTDVQYCIYAQKPHALSEVRLEGRGYQPRAQCRNEVFSEQANTGQPRYFTRR